MSLCVSALGNGGKEDAEEDLGRGENEVIGEIVVGVVEFGVMFPSTDAKHGPREVDEVVGKILGPAHGSEDVLDAASAVFLDMLNVGGIVFGGAEGVAKLVEEHKVVT